MSIESIIELSALEIPGAINLLLITLYWPNSSREVETFYLNLEKLLNMLLIKETKKNIIIGGDFNVNFLVNNKATRTLSTIMLKYNFHQLVRDATRVTRNSATCLDLVFVNFNYKDCKINTHEFGLSDHKGVELIIPISTNYPKIFTISKRIYNDFNINNFRYEIQNINWDHIIHKNKTINENYDCFYKTFKTALNKNIPIKTIKIKPYQKTSYLTQGLKISCRNKRTLRLLLSQTNSTTLKNYCKTYNKILKKTIQQSKKK